MFLHSAIAAFINQVKETSLLEWLGIFFAVAEVLLARRNSILLYPAGIISTAIYTWLFVQPQAKLYADAILNSYYFIMSVYGWYVWAKNKSGIAIPITRCNKQDWLTTITITISSWVILYWLLTKGFVYIFPWYSVSDVAFWDALISAIAWAGMWLLAKRKIENWLVLNVSNLIAIPIYIYKNMPFTACLTIFLFLVAILGYIDWNKIYSEHKKQALT